MSGTRGGGSNNIVVSSSSDTFVCTCSTDLLVLLSKLRWSSLADLPCSLLFSSLDGSGGSSCTLKGVVLYLASLLLCLMGSSRCGVGIGVVDDFIVGCALGSGAEVGDLGVTIDISGGEVGGCA